MNWEAISSISDLLASLAVIISLIYLAFQVKQSNILAQGQTRKDMMELGQNELYKIYDDPNFWDLMEKEKINHEERIKLHVWLIASMRLREFEWSQYRFGIVDDDTYEGHREVIPIILGTARTREWWNVRGKLAFNPEFIIFVDELLENRALSKYWKEIGENW